MMIASNFLNVLFGSICPQHCQWSLKLLWKWKYNIISEQKVIVGLFLPAETGNMFIKSLLFLSHLVCFKVFDVDRDGVLSRDELHEMVVALLEVWKDNRTDTLPVSFEPFCPSTHYL